MKQVVVVRGDLALSKGKLAAQVAHASLGAYRKTEKKTRKNWKNSGEKKAVVEAEDKGELLELRRNADNLDLPTHLVKDAGRTEIPEGTATALAVGPAEEEKVDKVTGHLPLMK
ncbi:MAG: peptidyl-tRNA hydrolase Pth2 [Candidatus Aenigmatarchaeota archaeon]